MTAQQFNWTRGYVQLAHSDIAKILDSIDDTQIVWRLNQYRLKGGPRTYSIRSFWRAYLLMFVKDIPSTNHLIRELSNDPLLTALCGFSQVSSPDDV